MTIDNKKGSGNCYKRLKKIYNKTTKKNFYSVKKNKNKK